MCKIKACIYKITLKHVWISCGKKISLPKLFEIKRSPHLFLNQKLLFKICSSYCSKLISTLNYKH